MKRSSIKSGIIWTLAAQIVEISIGILIMILVARILGPENYGLLQTVLAILILSTMMSDLGISSSVSRYAAKNINFYESVQKFIFNGIGLKLLLSVCMSLIFFSFFPLIERLLDVELEGYKYLIIILIVLRSFREFFHRAFQGIMQLKYRAKVNSFYFMCTAVTTTLLLLSGFGVESVLISEVLFTIVIIPIYILKLKKLDLLNVNNLFSVDELKSILLYALPMFFISISFYIYTKSDVLMIQYFLNAKEVGYYSIAMLLVTKVHFPLVALGQASAPAFASLSIEKRTNLFIKVFTMTLVMAMPISVGLFLVSEPLIISFFGSDYNISIRILQLFCIYLFFYGSNSVFSPILDYLGYAKTRSILVVVSAVANVTLNIYFIPKFGIVGAAYSTIITYSIYAMIIIIIVMNICIKPLKLYIGFLSTNVMKLMLSTFTMAFSVFMLRQFTFTSITYLILTIATGSITYISSVFLTRVVSYKELKSLLTKTKIT